MLSHPVMVNSLQPHGLRLARLLCPRNFSGKNTGVGCHFLFQGIFPTLHLLHWQAGSSPQVPPGEALSACWLRSCKWTLGMSPSWDEKLSPIPLSLVLLIAKPETGTWLFGRWFRIENISFYPMASLFTHYLSVWARVLSSTWFLGPIIQSFP